MVLKRTDCFFLSLQKMRRLFFFLPPVLSAFSADASRELDVLGHDGHSLRVDSAEIRVLEETDEVSFAGLLERHDGRTLEAEVRLEILCDFAYQTLEGQFPDQEFGALLVTANLTQRDGTGTIAVRFLHASGGRCALPGRFRGQLLSRRLAAGRFARSLLGTCHIVAFNRRRRSAKVK